MDVLGTAGSNICRIPVQSDVRDSKASKLRATPHQALNNQRPRAQGRVNAFICLGMMIGLVTLAQFLLPSRSLRLRGGEVRQVRSFGGRSRIPWKKLCHQADAKASACDVGQPVTHLAATYDQDIWQREDSKCLDHKWQLNG